MNAIERRKHIEKLDQRLAKLCASLNEVQRNEPITSLRLNHRAKASLLAGNYRTVGDVCSSSCETILGLRNLGIGSLEGLIDDLRDEFNSRQVESKTLAQMLRRNSTGMKYRQLLLRRMGVDGPHETLDEIGASMNITRERVRQLEQLAVAEVLAGNRGADLRRQVEQLAKLEPKELAASPMLAGVANPAKTLRILYKGMANE